MTGPTAKAAYEAQLAVRAAELLPDLSAGERLRVEELEHQVADLAAQVEQLRQWRKFDYIYVDEIEIRAEERGFQRGRAITRLSARARAAARGQRPTHLRVVTGASR